MDDEKNEEGLCTWDLCDIIDLHNKDLETKEHIDEKDIQIINYITYLKSKELTNDE